MEKQIFIPISAITDKLDSLVKVDDETVKTTLNYLAWLGYVNQQLGNKANCKEIVSVEYRNNFIVIPSNKDLFADIEEGEIVLANYGYQDSDWFVAKFVAKIGEYVVCPILNDCIDKQVTVSYVKSFDKSHFESK